MANILRKMKLIFWKNMIIRRCHWLMTSLEIVVPVLFYVLFASLRTLLPEMQKTYENETQYYPPEISEFSNIQYLYFAPNNTGTSKIMNNVHASVSCSRSDCEFLGFPTEESMVNYIMDEKKDNYYDIISVVFNNVFNGNLPKKLDYRVRGRPPSFDMDKLYSSQPPYQGYEYGFYSYQIKTIQIAIDSAFIKLQNPKADFEISTQIAPDPPHWISFSLNVIFSSVIPICTIFSFMLVFVGVIQRILEEKSSGIKELMKMMGLESWMLWLGWYIHSIVTIATSVTIITIVLKVPMESGTDPLIAHSDGFLLWLFLFLYCSSGVFFCFLVTTWFKKPMMGTSVGSVAWIITAVPVLLLGKQDGIGTAIRDLILIFPNTGITFGFKTLYEYEDMEIGLQWSNLFSVPNEYYPYTTLGKIYLFLILDSIIFLFLTWYIDNVNPGDYGVRRPFNFLFKKSYWCAKVEDMSILIDSEDDTFQGEIEPAPSNLEVGIKIRDLQKEFKKKKAVNGLSFDIYTNQITILLGHNGAGKTTTMNIVTGMIAPTRGTVQVDGYSVLTNMDKVRESLGLCPQHNMQFPDLSVLQHLIFFGMLKGKSKSESEQEGLEFLSKLCMSDKANKKASELSGGMRRRLSLGMALVGNTKVLMLDEPTSGMDPEARREIWDLLLSMRGSRTILITTHYMEEADILGDRIAIMHSGQLMCYGTSMFLKKHYGTGYVLSVLLTGKVDVKPITNAIAKYIPNVTIKNMTVGSVKFEIPTSDTSALSQLFLDLESKKTELGITSFGISITTMDDVFLKVGKLADESYSKNNLPSETNSEASLITAPDTHVPVEKYNAGFNLVLQQFWALLVKRVLYYRYAWLLLIIAILMPLVFEIATILINQGLGADSNVTRVFKIGDYPNTLSYYSVDRPYDDIKKRYNTVVKEQNSVAELTDHVLDAIIKMGLEEPMKFPSTIITAAEFNSTNGNLVANAIFGKFGLHSLPISINLVTNTLLKYFMADDSYSITTSYNPLPNVFNIGLEVTSANWTFFYPLGLVLLVAILLGFHNAERLSGIKHLQIMSGISRIMYWLNNYFVDMLVFLFMTILSIIIIAVLDPTLSRSDTLQALTALIILFGLAVFPFSYFFHYRPTSGSVITFMIWCQIICGIILPNVIIIWQMFKDKQACLRELLTHIFFLIPNYSFTYGLNILVTRAVEIHKWDSMTENKKLTECHTTIHVCCDANSEQCKEFYNYYAGDNSILKPILFLTGEIFLYFIIFLFVDYGLLRKYFDKAVDYIKRVSVDTQIHDLDSDVSDERDRVAAQINESRHSPIHSRSDILLVANLRKWFRNFHAVKGLNFGVKQSECFGLLGINGAGKTTTFKMLTGEIFLSTGTAQLLNYSLFKNKSKYLNQIGYCPQFDAFNFNLSTRQMLTFFAHVRGIPENQVKHQVDKWLNKFDIMKYQHIQCSKMSGGNKRKLSTAIALIGDPPLIMLDEPTSGVDPVARRNLWGILGVLRKSGQSIVLTSHSMDECEALCDRLAIMVDGQMKCIGGIQYLKNKFGQGFTMMIKLRNISTVHEGGDNDIEISSDITRLKQTIEHKYASTLKDEHKGMIMYHITDESATLGEIFQFMEEVKRNQSIVEDFTVSDTSLEQVFLSFAKEKLAAKDKVINNVV